MAIQSGKSCEIQVMGHLVEERRHIAFALHARIPDTTGQYDRQIDVWLPDTREIVECKHYAERVGFEIVDRLVGTTQDVGAAAAHIFSSSGFTRQAHLRAEKAGITCATLPFATEFETLCPPRGGGYCSGQYIELCQCAIAFRPTGTRGAA
jgi:hypothetical protein